MRYSLKMSIRIYNSLTKRKDELVPLDGNTVNMYSCGVTVYDKCHIGHARSLCIFDMMRRYLKYRGYDVCFVRNITDVDDKIINKARERNKSFNDVVEENIAAYHRDLVNLGIAAADHEPRATRYIARIIDFIEKLHKKGYAYEVDGNVYFSVRKFKDYGKLSGQSVDQMLEATRIEQDPKKKDPLDFALWKKAKEDEQSWPSPWGDGRPGWHIECSCMSLSELKSETLDIHAGGRDLIFPHHENEIAQSEALTGKPFARHWIHHGLLTINGQKMAKSLGNFITLDQVLERYSSNVLKLFFFQSHYGSPVDFSWEKMDEVKKSLERITILVDKIGQLTTSAQDGLSAWGKTKKVEFDSAMDDDFNTPKALSVIFDIVSECNKVLDNDAQGNEVMLQEALALIQTAFGLFGIQIDLKPELTDEEKNLLAERIRARKNKDYKRSDELRDLLKEKGILVEDTKERQSWRRA